MSWQYLPVNDSHKTIMAWTRHDNSYCSTLYRISPAAHIYISKWIYHWSDTAAVLLAYQQRSTTCNEVGLFRSDSLTILSLICPSQTTDYRLRIQNSVNSYSDSTNTESLCKATCSFQSIRISPSGVCGHPSVCFS